jgi:hypothetical protein
MSVGWMFHTYLMYQYTSPESPDTSENIKDGDAAVMDKCHLAAPSGRFQHEIHTQ